MKILEKAQLEKSRWASNSAKVLLVTASALLALCATVVTCLIAFGSHGVKAVVSNGSATVPILSATNVPPATPAEKGNGAVTPRPDSNQPQNGTIAAEHSAIDQTLKPALDPIPTPAPVPQPESKAFGSDSELLKRERPDSAPKNPERQLPKSVRKNLEKERREAERKRSRLEDMYQKHLISGEAYKQGEKEYKSQIEKYRREVNAGGSLPNSLE